LEWQNITGWRKRLRIEPHPIFRDFIAASYQNHLRLTPDLIAEDVRTSNQ
jgi:hypothetical protein